MNAVEKAVLHAEVGDSMPRLVIRSNTRIDTGRWWWRSPLLLAVMEEELVIFAGARRRYACRIAFDSCRQSVYDHGSRELVLAPVEGLEHKRVGMSVSDALRVLHLIGVAA